jgi:hypothetical protein
MCTPVLAYTYGFTQENRLRGQYIQTQAGVKMRSFIEGHINGKLAT